MQTWLVSVPALFKSCYNAADVIGAGVRRLRLVFQSSPRTYIVSVWRDVRAVLLYLLRDRISSIVFFLLLLPWLSLFVLRDNLKWLDQLGAALGIVLGFWWMSRSGAAELPILKKPRAEFLFAVALIVLWITWRIAICAKLLFFLPAQFACYKSIEFEIAPKVFEMVVFPFIILWGAGYGLRAQGVNWNWRAWWIALPTIAVWVAYALFKHSENLSQFGERTFEFFFAAGITEEFLFRAILLTRLEVWWRNSAWALFGASVIFGLTHLPINYLVFRPNDMREAWITLLTFQMGLGAAFAFAYQRVRNVWPVALLHALVNAT